MDYLSCRVRQKIFCCESNVKTTESTVIRKSNDYAKQDTTRYSVCFEATLLTSSLQMMACHC